MPCQSAHSLMPNDDSGLSRISSEFLNCLNAGLARAFAGSLLIMAGIASGAAQLQPITVDAARMERSWLQTPAALSVVARRDVAQGRQYLSLDESLGRVPGLFLQNRYNFAQGLRISIRGFGSQAPFGVRGVKLLVDGIPETLVDGQSQTDIIDLTSVETIEVIRGPSSALYGNATGGVIKINTLNPPSYPLRRLRLQYGSFGYHRESLQVGNSNEDFGYFVSIYNFGYQGFRAHSAADSQVLNAKFDVALLADARLRIVVRALRAPGTEDPGALNRTAVANDRSQARQRNVDLDSHQDAYQQTVGLIFDNPIGKHQHLRAKVFYTHRDYIQYLPFVKGAVVGYDRAFFGGGLQFTTRDDLWGHRNAFTTGLDVAIQRDDRQRYDNINGDKGPLVFDQLEIGRSLGIFARNVFTLTKRLAVTTGLRYDHIRLEINDDFIRLDNPGTGLVEFDPDDSGHRSFSQFSGSLALSYALAPRTRLYATVGTGFQTPTFTEFADPDGTGGFNPDVKPQQAVNYELGLHGFVTPRLRYQLAIFQVETEDELVVFESDSGRDYYQNSGETQRRGLEAQLVWNLASHLRATAAFTYSNFQFERFIDKNGAHYAGKRMPGIPESQLFGELAWRKPGAGFAILEMRIFDELYADNANRIKVNGYAVFNARLGIEERLWRRRLTLYFGVNNVLDTHYLSNIRVNAFGGRYFEPAPGRNLYVGMKLEL